MPKKILLADDSLTIQKVVELTFSDSDFTLICVGNGQRALEKVREDRPDLILADAVMPEKNGYEVCEAIKGDPATSRIPIILLTGTFEPFDRTRAERIGADAIVSKPFDSQQLLRQVEALLARAGAAPSAATVAMRIPEEISLGAGAPPGRGVEAEPFDTGFSPDDFTGSIRVPTGDPFEEEFGRGDVDSAIEAFEKAESVPAVPARTAGGSAGRVRGGDRRVFLARRRAGASGRTGAAALGDGRDAPGPGALRKGDDADACRRSADRRDRRGPLRPASHRAASRAGQPDAGRRDHRRRRRGPFRCARTGGVSPPSPRPPRTSRTRWPRPKRPRPSQELEALAQTSSIPELAQMLSSVSRGGDLSEADIDRLAARIVEKLSDRVIREIAWEVIPDMAEIVIKQRIKELEAGLE